MLGRVLLHVIETPLPVQEKVDLPVGHRRREDVANCTVDGLDVEDPYSPEDAVIGRLPASLRVENRVI
jgi:hypothetical protein